MYRLVLSIFLVASLFPLTASAGDVFVGKQSSGRTALDNVDHGLWNALLKKYVDRDGMVNYKAWHASKSDTQKLDQYLATLSNGNVGKSTKNAKLAFWVNAYNAVTIRGILREFPTTSIRNHTARFFGYNIWKNLKLYVGRRSHSLDGIEHEILRKTNDPRIHFAIVCASKGCPRLLDEAYTVSRVQQQLDLNAKDFFRRRQNFRYDKQRGRFYVSTILSWFAEDFGADQAAQLRTIAKWLPTSEAQQAALRNSVSVSYLSYDWNLNIQPAGGGVVNR